MTENKDDMKSGPNTSDSSPDPAPDSLPDTVLKASCSISLAIVTAISSVFLSMFAVKAFIYHGQQSAWGFEFLLCFGAPIPALLSYFITFFILDSKKGAYERSLISAFSGTLISCVTMLLLYGVLIGQGHRESKQKEHARAVNSQFWSSYFKNYSTYNTSTLKNELENFGTEKDGLQSQLPYSRTDRIDELVKILAEQQKFTLLKILIERVNLSRSSAELIFNTAYSKIALKTTGIVQHQNTSNKTKGLNYTPPQLARDKSAAVGALVALAENASTPSDILERLGHFPMLHVIRAVIENPNSSENTYRIVFQSKAPPADYYNLNKEIYFHGGSGEWSEIVERAEGAHKIKMKRMQAIRLVNQARRVKDLSKASELYLEAREIDSTNAEACIMGEYSRRKAGIFIDSRNEIGRTADHALKDLVDKHGGWYDLQNTRLIVTALFLTKQSDKAFELMATLRKIHPQNSQLMAILSGFPEKPEQIESFLSP